MISTTQMAVLAFRMLMTTTLVTLVDCNYGKVGPKIIGLAARAVQQFDNGNFNSYWEGVGHVYKPNGGGNYTGCKMRSGYYGGNNCGEWRVRSGQRWWIRDNNHSEPNGDYNGNGFLRIYGGSRPNGTNISTSMGYNDGGAYGIGSRYLLSTNTKT